MTPSYEDMALSMAFVKWLITFGLAALMATLVYLIWDWIG